MDVHGPPAQAGGPSANGVGQQGNMGMVPEVGYGLSGLGPPGSQEPASQSSEPTSPHTDFAGGIMRIAPAEVNVSGVPSDTCMGELVVELGR
jgi:transcription factor E2F3